jgi:hypothetical protein
MGLAKDGTIGLLYCMGTYLYIFQARQPCCKVRIASNSSGGLITVVFPSLGLPLRSTTGTIPLNSEAGAKSEYSWYSKTEVSGLRNGLLFIYLRSDL